MIPILGFVVALSLLLVILWWLLIRTEGVYLGKRVVIWLYDVYATRYDGIVQHDEIDEHLHLAQPIIERLQPHHDPFVLDVATGTGRIPLALCQHPQFEGHVVSLDLSRGMLRQAAQKIQAQHFEDYVTFIWADGSRLPFDDNSFDLVTCMEALEFMPQPEAVLRELVRVLRRGGLLLTTRRINEPLMLGKLWSKTEMRRLLIGAGVEQIEFEGWQYDYTKVWATKQGQSAYVGAVPLDGFLRCPCCAGTMVQNNCDWRCIVCDAAAPIAHDGVIEFQPISPQ